MAYHFFGVYFQDAQGIEYRCGYNTHGKHMPLLEQRSRDGWVEVSHSGSECSAICRDIREELPVSIAFPWGQTQNECMELINQLVYNINRYTTEYIQYHDRDETVSH